MTLLLLGFTIYYFLPKRYKNELKQAIKIDWRVVELFTIILCSFMKYISTLTFNLSLKILDNIHHKLKGVMK